jgi:hypothetical protein
MARRQPHPPADAPAVPALVAVLVARGQPPDAELVRLLLAIRQANVIANRAIEDYLQLRPARSERVRGTSGPPRPH